MRILLFLLLLGSTLRGFGQTQPRSIFLQILTPHAELFLSEYSDLVTLRQLMADQLTSMGYRVVHDREEFARLAATRYPDFLYADVICSAPGGGKPNVTLLVRDSLNNVWYQHTEDRTGLSLGATAGSITAARHLVRLLPTRFSPRTLIGSVETEAPPNFLTFGEVGFFAYLHHALSQTELRRKLKAEGLQAQVQIDALGFASLQRVVLPATLTDEEIDLLERLVLASPRWRPAYAGGRRVATTLTFRWNRP
ncbi:hypothetical protein K3G63_00290 [Hymenobacter sp. HSC-4F20]|uniref:hypothetical protein n=1 Tax=Hymenobacter sp. HSC-4F20 TaxID=2864135 RepID=UPI001C731BF9|nr:hypothetical protein [Hymenobacter sp. HSC-4F20]MBX0288851.1 hypothetical protein [Hymenobacter sp. HSC-4F20]